MKLCYGESRRPDADAVERCAKAISDIHHGYILPGVTYVNGFNDAKKLGLAAILDQQAEVPE